MKRCNSTDLVTHFVWKKNIRESNREDAMISRVKHSLYRMSAKRAREKTWRRIVNEDGGQILYTDFGIIELPYLVDASFRLDSLQQQTL